MTIIAIGFIIFLLCISVIARIIFFNPLSTLYYLVLDSILYIIHRGWNYLEGGKLNALCAEFGGGKTLSAVHDISSIFKKYNNKMVWDRSRHKFVLQKINVISNVEFKTIPFEPLTSLSQVVNAATLQAEIDNQQDTHTVTYVFIDEASVQLNSRNFKNNIDPLFLNSLLTCRHYHINLYYTTQKFNLTDKLLRDVTQRVIQCRKIWRFMIHSVYSADDMEYASDPTLIKPLYRTGYLIRNKYFAEYNTLACVDNLKKSVESGDMMSASEILAFRGLNNPDNDNIAHPSRKYTRRSGRR